MKVFKFGGASVKNAEAVKNIGTILSRHDEKLVVVISAMGKTTNLLEKLVKAYFEKSRNTEEFFREFKKFHQSITDALFGPDKTPREIVQLYSALENKLQQAPSLDFNFEYDQVVSYGELVSTRIVSAYLTRATIGNRWVDIRTCLKTDSHYREATVDWLWSGQLMPKIFNFRDAQCYITQGFIGATISNITTTLGREGSDYTAAIIGNLLDAKEVFIWKDVPGILHADPQQLDVSGKMDELSYREAIEMSHSGAKVIHPKTIKPLYNKNIPLYIKSFLDPESPGTVIHSVTHPLSLSPVYIIKENQVLITLSPNDFSFIGAEDIASVFALLTNHRFKINLFQQSAIDLNLVVDFPEKGFEEAMETLKSRYEVKYNTRLDMVTIRYYTDEAMAWITKGKKVLMEQKSRRTARLVLKNGIGQKKSLP